MHTTTYGYTKVLDGTSFDDAITKVTAALKEEGFGILTEIDVSATLKAKIDVDFRKYKILGACNPPLAHKALTGEPFIGLLLPCNVIVFEDDDGKAVVSMVNPHEMFKVVDNPGLAEIVETVSGKLQTALANT